MIVERMTLEEFEAKWKGRTFRAPRIISNPKYRFTVTEIRANGSQLWGRHNLDGGAMGYWHVRSCDYMHEVSEVEQKILWLVEE